MFLDGRPCQVRPSSLYARYIQLISLFHLVACFYIYKSGDESPSERYYRTIYLRERTAQDLILRICEKCGVDASKVSRILHTDVNKAGIEILVDDDFVQQMTEGQDMIVKIEELPVIDVGVEPGANTQLGIWLEY